MHQPRQIVGVCPAAIMLQAINTFFAPDTHAPRRSMEEPIALLHEKIRSQPGDLEAQGDILINLIRDADEACSDARESGADIRALIDEVERCARFALDHIANRVRHVLDQKLQPGF